MALMKCYYLVMVFALNETEKYKIPGSDIKSRVVLRPSPGNLINSYIVDMDYIIDHECLTE